jgi:hypothetical protein
MTLLAGDKFHYVNSKMAIAYVFLEHTTMVYLL